VSADEQRRVRRVSHGRSVGLEIRRSTYHLDERPPRGCPGASLIRRTDDERVATGLPWASRSRTCAGPRRNVALLEQIARLTAVRIKQLTSNAAWAWGRGPPPQPAL